MELQLVLTVPRAGSVLVIGSLRSGWCCHSSPRKLFQQPGKPAVGAGVTEGVSAGMGRGVHAQGIANHVTAKLACPRSQNDAKA